MLDNKKWKTQRQELLEISHRYANKNLKRLFSVDSQAYKAGQLSPKQKELLGLSTSLVLRCADCIRFHTIGCFEAGVNDAELGETLEIACLVGGEHCYSAHAGSLCYLGHVKMQCK